MSLTNLVESKDVTAKFGPFRPKLPRKIPAQLKVQPRSTRYQMVGTAFDYLLRFELQRQAPYAVLNRLVAEYAPDTFWKQDEGGRKCVSMWKDDKGLVSLAVDPDTGLGDEELAKETSELARIAVEKAKSSIAAYSKNNSPTISDRAELARHAIRLAKLDGFYRARRFDPSFGEAAQEGVEDLLELLAIAPTQALRHEKVLILNPTFGEASRVVGGCDGDLITGDTLVDFKTTIKNEMQSTHLDQLLGMFFLARQHRHANPEFPDIKRAGFYFCRHGYLWSFEATTWTDHPEFSELEQWFRQRCGTAQAEDSLGSG